MWLLFSRCFFVFQLIWFYSHTFISPGVAGQCSASLLLEYQSNTHHYRLNTHQTQSQEHPPPHLVSFECILVGQQSHLDTEYDCCCRPYILYTQVSEALVEVNKALGYHCKASVVKTQELTSFVKKSQRNAQLKCKCIFNRSVTMELLKKPGKPHSCSKILNGFLRNCHIHMLEVTVRLLSH